jgi:hypothetical protein
MSGYEFIRINQELMFGFWFVANNKVSPKFHPSFHLSDGIYPTKNAVLLPELPISVT